jgi:hypothetical protein
MITDKDKYLQHLVCVPEDDYSESIQALCNFMEEQSKLKLHVDSQILRDDIEFCNWVNFEGL